MSIPVDLERLREAAVEHGAVAFLLTASAGGRPHAVAVQPRWDGDLLVVDAGRTTTANAAARPLVSLLWPPTGPDGYSLIVDGDAVAHEGHVAVRPTRAVLHRPAPAPSTGGSCGSDCISLG